MYLDGYFNFGLPIITNSTTATASTNILDAGSSKFMFGAQAGKLFMWVRATITADASPTFRCDFVASDESDLDPNDNGAVRNLILASTGIVTDDPSDGLALASGDTLELVVPVRAQTAARRYYGMIVTLGGTNPDLAAASRCTIVRDAQTNMPGARAAVPA